LRERFRTTTLKARLIVSAIVVVLVVLVVSLFLLARNTETVDINNTNSSDIEYLPVMPGAYSVKPSERGPLLWKGLGFEVRKNTADIFQFYKAELPSRGWVLKYESPLDAYMPLQTYYWEDTQDRTPYIRTFDVSIEFGRVWLTVARIPILDRTPLYPGAQNVEKKQQCIHIPEPDGLCEVPQTLITYTVQVAQQEVEDYYKDTLAQYGWTNTGFEAHDDTTGAYIKGSMVFVWGIGQGPESHQRFGASVTLLANETTDNQTEVDLDLRGDNKYSP
jgi:hypothetical protein